MESELLLGSMCPVCGGKVYPSSYLSSHIESHSKQEILLTLLKQRRSEDGKTEKLNGQEILNKSNEISSSSPSLLLLTPPLFVPPNSSSSLSSSSLSSSSLSSSSLSSSSLSSSSSSSISSPVVLSMHGIVLPSALFTTPSSTSTLLVTPILSESIGESTLKTILPSNESYSNSCSTQIGSKEGSYVMFVPPDYIESPDFKAQDISEKGLSGSPTPGSSRDPSAASCDEDDITLQDLVAFETMEDEEEADNENETEEEENVENNESYKDNRCELCDLVFESSAEYRLHVCQFKKGGIGKKSRGVSDLGQDSKIPTFFPLTSSQPLDLKEFKCRLCSHSFETKASLLSHSTAFHSKLSKSSQDPLDKSNSFQPNNNEHNEEFVCPKCSRVFSQEEPFIKHMSCHEELKPFECLECGKRFGKSSLLQNHRKRHFEIGAFSCNYCDKRFYSSNKLKEHVRVHTGEAPLSCNICGKTFRRHSNLSEHRRTHLGNKVVKEPKKYFCTCGVVFSTTRDLNWHKEAVHDKKPKKCSVCGEIFVHSSSLTRHMRLRHESDFMPPDKKSNLYGKCPLCDLMLYKTSISKHIKVKHEGEKPFRCDVCHVSFVTKYNLLNHEWQHKGLRSRPHKCHLCQKAYLRQNLLEAHMRSHKGLKPFVCNECGLQFVNKSNWQRHVFEHSGTRNFECPHCDKRFSRSYYLRDHLKVHTGEKPYTCSVCGKTVATRSNYNSHLRTHVTREPVNSEV